MQVSFRYHCQLYTEWRRTNQKVHLLIPEPRESISSQYSLLSSKLMKKTPDESIVWDQIGWSAIVVSFFVWVPDARLAFIEALVSFFNALFKSVLNSLQYNQNVSFCGCRNVRVNVQSASCTQSWRLTVLTLLTKHMQRHWWMKLQMEVCKNICPGTLSSTWMRCQL